MVRVGCGGVGGRGFIQRRAVGRLLPLLLTVACVPSGEHEGSAGLPAGPAPPVVRDSAGVTIVESSEPQWTPGSAWCVGGLVTSVGKLEGEAPYQLFRVLDATRQSDGTVVVGNSSSGELRFFDEGGTFIRTVGNTDGGPGEFRGANALRALRRVPGDSLVTWDIYAQTASVFAPDGAFVRSFRLDGPSAQHFFIGIFEDASLLMKVFDHSRPPGSPRVDEGVVRLKFDLLHYGTDHALADTVGPFRDDDRFQASWGPQGIMSTDAPFGRLTSVGVSGERVLVATGDANEVAVYGRAGTLETLIRRTLPPVHVTQDMVDRDRARRIAQEVPELEEHGNSARVIRMYEDLPYPPVLPPYGTTVVDSEGNLWVQEVRMSAQEPPRWSVFDDAGVWLGTVEFPEGLRVFEIGADYILALTIDELEVERVAVHELLKDPGAPCAGGES